MAVKKSDWNIAKLQRTIDSFLEEYLFNKSRETVGTYRRSLNEFLRWFARSGSNFDFSTKDIQRYKTYLSNEKGLREVSVSTYLTAVRRLAQYLVDIGDLEENPARAIKGNRRPAAHTRRILDEVEIHQLLDYLDDPSQLGLRDAAMVYMMLFAGLGEIELVRADLEDLVQDESGWKLMVQGKGRTGKDQEVSIDSTVMDRIRLYLDTRGRIRPNDPLFVSHGHRSSGMRLDTRSVRTRINGILKNAGLKKPGLTPHSLTHTAAILWLNKGVDVEEVQKRMRHGTLDTTMIYYRQQEELRRMGGARRGRKKSQQTEI